MGRDLKRAVPLGLLNNSCIISPSNLSLSTAQLRVHLSYSFSSDHASSSHTPPAAVASEIWHHNAAQGQKVRQEVVPACCSPYQHPPPPNLPGTKWAVVPICAKWLLISGSWRKGLSYIRWSAYLQNIIPILREGDAIYISEIAEM